MRSASQDPVDRIMAIVRGRRVYDEGQARALRTRTGLSLREMARALDVTPNTLSRWETGASRPIGDKGQVYMRLLSELEARELDAAFERAIQRG